LFFKFKNKYFIHNLDDRDMLMMEFDKICGFLMKNNGFMVPYDEKFQKTFLYFFLEINTLKRANKHEHIIF
jgi:hypothetical protein